MWIVAAIAVASLLYTYLAMPRPSVPVSPKPDDAKNPTTEEGRPIPVVFGTVEIKDPSVTYFGNVDTLPIKSDGATIGYKYFLSAGMIVCHGPVDIIKAVLIDGGIITDEWWGYQDNGLGGYGEEIDKANLFGGETKGGGVSGILWMGFGAVSSGPDDGSVSHYPYGLCYVGFNDFYYGTSPYLKPMSVRVQRILKTSLGAEQWYPEKAAITAVGKLRGDYWKYLVTTDTGTSPSAADFDDSTWDVDVGGFGDDDYGMPPVGTTILGGGSAQRVWLRYDLGEMSAQGLVVDIWHVGTARVWFNGVELVVSRYGGQEGHSVAVIDPDDVVIEGPNVLAMQVLKGAALGTATLYAGASVFPAAFAQEANVVVDMNPIHVIRECLIDSVWWRGIDTADIDEDAFIACADRCYNEKCGISIEWNKKTDVLDFIKEILRHINGELYQSRTTGLITIVLIRDDYQVGGLLQLDETSIIKIDSLVRKTPGECLNTLEVKYTDGMTGNTGIVMAMDQGLIQVEGSQIKGEQSYPGFTNREIAAKAALRDLAVMSTPARSCEIYASRKAARLNLADPFVVNWPQLGLSGQPARVTADHLYDDVKLLLHYDSSDYIDETGNSTTGITVGRNVTTKHKKYGTASVGRDDDLYDGWETGIADFRIFGELNYLANFYGDFCVEAWVRVVRSSQPTSPVPDFVEILGNYLSGSGWAIQMGGGYSLQFTSGPYSASLGAHLSPKTWHHIALSRESGTLRFFLDGTLTHTATVTANLISLTGESMGLDTDVGCFWIGGGSGYAFPGQIDDVRITHAARYVADFVPPMVQLPGAEISGVVMRVAALSFGNGVDNTVKISAIEDIFSSPKYALTAIPDAWEAPTGEPPAPGSLLLTEMPYHELVLRRGRADADAILSSTPDAGLLLVASARVAGALNAQLWVSPTGTSGSTSLVGNIDLCPWARVTGTVSRTQTVLPYSSANGLSLVTIGDYAILSGGEVVSVVAINQVASTITVGRGCLDTVPTLLDTDALTALDIDEVEILFVQNYNGNDNRHYTATNEAGALVLPSNSKGVYPNRALVPGTDPELVFNSRANRPYPPANFQIDGVAFPSSVSATDPLILTWNHRDRKTQADFFFGSLLDTLAASVGPEAGVAYNARCYNDVDDLICSGLGLTGTSFELKPTFIYDEMMGLTPIAYYRLGEASGTTAEDETENNLDGTYTSCTLGTTGLDLNSPNTAVTFNGSSSRLEVTHNSVMNGNHLSVFAIVDTATSSGTMVIAARDSATLDSPHRQFQFLVVNGNIRARIFDSAGATSQDLTSTESIADGNPHTVGFSYDDTSSGRMLRLYIDGVNVTSTSGTKVLNKTANRSLMVGFIYNNLGTPNQFFNGIIDEVSVFSTVITTAQFLVLHNAARVQFDLGSELRIELESVRGGVTSYTKHVVYVAVNP